jgi:hypothetical protein
MADLRLHGRPVETVFDLLGDKEDDITYSLGWALAHSDGLCRALLREVFSGAPRVIVGSGATRFALVAAVSGGSRAMEGRARAAT